MLGCKSVSERQVRMLLSRVVCLPTPAWERHDVEMDAKCESPAYASVAPDLLRCLDAGLRKECGGVTESPWLIRRCKAMYPSWNS